MLVNLTPHKLNVHLPSGEIREISPSGTVPRVGTVRTPAGEIDGIPIDVSKAGEVEGLPAPQEGTYLVVSQVFAAACPDRKDLLIPGELIRDDKGRPIGCKGLTKLG